MKLKDKIEKRIRELVDLQRPPENEREFVNEHLTELPIHLEHILLAIEKQYNGGQFESTILQCEDKKYYLRLEIDDVEMYYNLSLPFSDQDESVYKLLEELLIK